MSRAAVKPPLRLLREAAGLTMKEAADKIGREIGESISSDYLNLLELRGTGMYKYIRAMALIYGVDMDTVAESARKQ